MTVAGGVSGHLPCNPDGDSPPQDCVGKRRGCGLQAIMTQMHHIKPGLSDPDRPEGWRRHQLHARNPDAI